MTNPTSSGPTTGTRLHSPALRAVVLVVLSLLLVASLVWLVAEALARRDGGVASASGPSTAVKDEREAVMSVSAQFVTRAFSYSPDDVTGGAMPAYEKRVKELLSTGAEAEFERFVQGVQQLVQEFKQKQTVDVYGTGVAELGGGQAQVLVTGAFNTTWYSGTERETQDDPIQFRYRVDLVEVEGEWLVDEFRGVSSTQDQSPGQGQAPAPDASPNPGEERP